MASESLLRSSCCGASPHPKGPSSKGLQGIPLRGREVNPAERKAWTGEQGDREGKGERSWNEEPNREFGQNR